MAGLNWSLFPQYKTPAEAQMEGANYAQKIQDYGYQNQQRQATLQAGQAYANGDYSGASQALARSGNLGDAQKVQQAGAGLNSAGQQYLAKVLPTFAAVAQKHASDPDGGASGRSQAFDQIAAEAQQMTGASPQAMQTIKQLWVTDPQGFLTRMDAMVPPEYKEANGQVFGIRGMKATPITPAVPKFSTVPFGSSVVPENQAAVDALNAQGQAQQQPGVASQTPAQPQTQILPTVNPQATAQVESGGNPNAVSPKGAVGTMQTMPGTLQSPGFGVQPAQSGSPNEQTRVGQDYLAAMQQRYGNPVFAHVAYNMGPGATDAWIQKGARWQDLPKETQSYLGQTALAQVQLQRQGDQQAPQGQPQGQGPARIGQPVGGGQSPIDNEAIKNDVRIWLASKGTINPQYGMGQLGAAQRMAFDQQKNALMKELNVSPEDVASGQAMRKADTQSLTSLTKQRDTIKAFEGTASKNADLALSLLDKGGPQGQAPIINKWTQEWRKWVSGDPNVSQYTVALGTFADEYAKVVAGQNGATDSVRAAAYDRINGAMNKGAIRAVIGTMKQEMANRTASNDEGISEIKTRLGAPQSSNPAPAAASSGPKIRVFNPKTGKLE